MPKGIKTSQILNTTFCGAFLCVGLPLLGCDFESDLCGFQQATDDDTDWKRHSGSTLSQDTGPTTGNKASSNYYIYFEATSLSANAKAR